MEDQVLAKFTLWPPELLQKIVQSPALPAEMDAGYRILLDKDRPTQGINLPTCAAYIPAPPTNEDYQKATEEFFSDVPYVAKCLLRGELLPTKWCLDHDMKYVYLRPMLEGLMGLYHNWSLPTGSLGKGLKKNCPGHLSAKGWFMIIPSTWMSA